MDPLGTNCRCCGKDCKADHYYVLVKKAQPPDKAEIKRVKLCPECGADWFDLIDAEAPLLPRNNVYRAGY